MKSFCEKHNLTENQFYGKVEISGSLDLRSLTSIPEGFNPTVGDYLDLGSLTSIPEGFNPTVGGSLDLRLLTSIPEGFNPTVGGYLDLESLTSIPEGFNPTVGGYLDLRSLTSIPEGFNPTVGGFLDLRSLTSIPEGFNPTVGGSLDLRLLTSIPEGFNKNDYQYKEIPFIKWGIGNGTHILCDGRFSELISKKGNVWKLKDVGKNNEYYLVTDGKGKYSHGETIKDAKTDLIFKISNRDKSVYKNIDINEKMPFDKCIEMYRIITGACSAGTRNFIEQKNLPHKKYSVVDIVKITIGAYGNNDFRSFFNIE